VYHLNAHGRVACFDAATGKELWAVDVLERFGGKNITWGLSECLLVDGPRVIVTPGGTQALMAALDKKTGKTVWITDPLLLGQSDSPAQERLASPAGQADSASYTSPILFELAGRRHLVSCSLRHAFGVDADTGRLLWTRPLPTQYLVIAATPVLVGDAVFVTAPDAEGGKLFRLQPDGAGLRLEKLWTTSLDTCHGGLVYVEGRLFGSWYRRAKGWASLDLRTGEPRHELKDLAMGSVLYADQRLYCLSQEGEMALIKPTPAGLEYTGRFRLVPDRVSDVWAHPVIWNRRLFLRFQDTLFCYDIRAD
jgi:outer membrane protein assembly factor BamB